MRHGIFRFQPLLWVLIPFTGGIAGSNLFAIPLFVFIVAALLSLIGMVAFHRRLNRYYGERLSVVCFACSVFLFFGSIAAYRTGLILHDTRSISLPDGSYRIELLQPSSQKQGWSAVEARLISSESDSVMRQMSKVLLILQGKNGSDDSLLAGTYLDIHTSFTPILPEKDPFSPDLSSYYRSKKVLARAFADTLHWQRSDSTIHLSWANKLQNIQFHLAKTIDRKIENQTASALMKAMLLGYKTDLSPQTKAEFRASGLSHILAVSGLHVGIVALLISVLSGFIPTYSRFRWIKWAISIILIFGYAALTGFSVSVVRASLLFAVLRTAYYFRMQRNVGNVLCLVALLQLAYNPLSLFDIGFQLSYTAVAAILWINSKLSPTLIRFSLWKQRLIGAISVTVGVQLALIPLILYHFHQFPIGFLPANLIILPLLSWVMGGGFIWLFTALFGWEWNGFTRFVEQSFEVVGDTAAFFGNFQPAALDRLWVSPLTSLLLLATGVSIYFYYKKKSSLKSKVVIITIGLLITSILLSHFQRSNYRRFAIYAQGKTSALHIVTHTSSWLIPLEGKIDSARLNKKTEGVLSYKSSHTTYTIRSPHHSRTIGYESPLLESCGKRFIIADSTIRTDRHPQKPLKIDYLILTSTFRHKVEILHKWCIPHTVICTPRVAQRTIESLQNDTWSDSCRIVRLKHNDSFIQSF